MGFMLGNDDSSRFGFPMHHDGDDDDGRDGGMTPQDGHGHESPSSRPDISRLHAHATGVSSLQLPSPHSSPVFSSSNRVSMSTGPGTAPSTSIGLGSHVYGHTHHSYASSGQQSSTAQTTGHTLTGLGIPAAAYQHLHAMHPRQHPNGQVPPTVSAPAAYSFNQSPILPA